MDRQDMVRAIKIAMASKNMSAADLAEKTKFSPQMVSRMLKGAHDFNIGEIVTLEMVLDENLLLIPDTERIITVKMDIDTSRHAGQVSVNVIENGKPKTEWKEAQLVATANALMLVARDYLAMATTKLNEADDRRRCGDDLQ